jgi:hypothetical protein
LVVIALKDKYQKKMRLSGYFDVREEEKKTTYITWSSICWFNFSENVIS